MLMIVEVISSPSSSWMFASPPFAEAGFVMFGFWVRSAPHGTPRITCGGGEGNTPNRADERTQIRDIHAANARPFWYVG
jgi:hypothetical protein